MNIDVIKVGPLRTNCYIVSKDNVAIIIDPGADALKMYEALGNKKVVGVYYTHSHYDHVDALDEVCKHYNLEANSFKNDYFEFDVIDNPGHHVDDKTYYFKNEGIMFTGDFIFKDTIGRTDLPQSDNSKMVSSLKLFEKYPENIKIYPGHGNDTMLGNEQRHFAEYYSFLQ